MKHRPVIDCGPSYASFSMYEKDFFANFVEIVKKFKRSNVSRFVVIYKIQLGVGAGVETIPPPW